MYKNIDEKMKAGKRFSANILIAFFILLVLAIAVSYLAGWVDSKNVDKETVENFNTPYKTENFHIDTENDTLWYSEYEIDSVKVFILDLKHRGK